MTRLPILRALAAQMVALVLIVSVGSLWPGRLDLVTALCLQGAVAAGVGWWLGLAWWWVPMQLALPWAVVWQTTVERSAGWYAAALIGTLLLFGGGVWTRVPLYNSNRAAWEALLALLPARPGVRFVDLGAGLAGPLRFLAARRPDAVFVGVEASPLVWLLAWLRTLPVRRNCRVRLGSLWAEDLRQADVVYAFLSPVPMPRVWGKVAQEMRAGSVFVSNTFEVPGVDAARRIEFPGRPDACLLVWER